MVIAAKDELGIFMVSFFLSPRRGGGAGRPKTQGRGGREVVFGTRCCAICAHGC